MDAISLYANWIMQRLASFDWDHLCWKDLLFIVLMKAIYEGKDWICQKIVIWVSSKDISLLNIGFNI